MTSKRIAWLLSTLLFFLTFTAQASLVGSDFELIIQANDSSPPFNSDGQIDISYGVWMINNTDQNAVFGDNLFGPSSVSVSILIDGIPVTDSEAYVWDIFAPDNFFDDGTMEPGELYYLGGISIFFDPSLLPGVSTVRLTALSLKFRNTSPLHEDVFMV